VASLSSLRSQTALKPRWVALLTGLFGIAQACDPAEGVPTPTGSGGTGAEVAAGGGAVGGKTSVPAVQPSRASERGSACSVRNDCGEHDSCVRGLCQPTEFGIRATGKECYQIDCSKPEDCCGNLSQVVPDKCRNHAVFCSAALPGCTQSSCTRSSDCVGGGVCAGHCSVTAGECAGAADCLDNECVGGRCALDFAPCGSGVECAANVCRGGECQCENSAFDPADPVCDDPDCDDLCLWTCEDSRCVLPSDCEASADCFGATPICESGKCVECARAADCSFGRICLEGRCETACRSDLQCGLFEACQAGECIYVGCRADRECTLLSDRGALGLNGVDPRLLRCATVDGVGHCIVPCQTDAQCATNEVCEGGICEYIGCETNAECKTILGVYNVEANRETPWISHLECR
jgi:hypothetical protein